MERSSVALKTRFSIELKVFPSSSRDVHCEFMRRNHDVYTYIEEFCKKQNEQKKG